MANVAPVYEKGNRSDKDNYHSVSILQIYQNILKGVCANKLSHFSRISFLRVNAGLGKIVVVITAY